MSFTPTNVFAYDSVTIKFSNIGNIKYTLPPLENYTTVVGLMVDGSPMVKITDIASVMGATVSYSSNSWYLERNLQTTAFVKDSQTMYTSNVYQYYDPISGTNDEYSHTWTAALPVAAQEINGYKYIPLIIAAKQLGALLAEPYSSNEYHVFDFRINLANPLNDSNEYIVGGSWLTDWTDETYLSDHFKKNEMWSNPSYGYARQLKMAVTALESAERVRHYYNNDSSMGFSCAFRSWAYNSLISTAAVNSVHMRGRAWDCGIDALYTSLFNEFRAGQTYPISSYDTLWESRVPTTSYSRGFEIEKMPVSGSTWLHLQRQPGYTAAKESP